MFTNNLRKTTSLKE